MVSAIVLFAAVTKHYRRQNSGYQPLKSTATTSYGAVDSSSQHSSVAAEEDDYADSEDTLVTSLDNHKSFTIFDATRFLAMLLAGFSLYNLVSVVNNHYDSDNRVESDKLALIIQYTTGTVVWVCKIYKVS